MGREREREIGTGRGKSEKKEGGEIERVAKGHIWHKGRKLNNIVIINLIKKTHVSNFLFRAPGYYSSHVRVCNQQYFAYPSDQPPPVFILGELFEEIWAPKEILE